MKDNTMAFGIPGSDGGGSGGNGPFLGRIQYDARVGFWKIVKRIQAADGWTDDVSEPFQKPTFLMDMGSLEVGYIKLTSPPAFLLVPYGQAIPPQPQEMTTDALGKQKKAFLPGFRVKVCGKVFGDSDAYHFSGSAKTVLGPMDDLYNTFLASPEAATGKIPAVANTGSKIVEIQNPKGNSKFYAPIFAIVGWADRPAAFGERTVPAPTGKPAAAAPPAYAAPVPNHVPPPTAPAAKTEMADSEMPF